MELQVLKIKDIRPYERNARKNDQAVDAVAKSIAEKGGHVWQGQERK